MKKIVLSLVFLVNCVIARADIVFPQIAVGGGYQTRISIFNRASDLWDGDLTVGGQSGPISVTWRARYQADGIDKTGDGLTIFNIHRGSTVSILLTNNGPAQAGFLRIHTRSPWLESNIAAAVFYDYLENGELVDTTPSLPAVAYNRYVFPFSWISGREDTGVAIVSLRPFFPISIRLNLNQSELLQQSSEHKSVFLSEVFREWGWDSKDGWATITSESPFYLVVIRIDLTRSGQRMTSILPTRLPQ